MRKQMNALTDKRDGKALSTATSSILAEQNARKEQRDAEWLAKMEADENMVNIDGRWFDKRYLKRETPQERYDRNNTVRVALKLNTKTDADILKRLEEVGNKQGYIKELIRKELRYLYIRRGLPAYNDIIADTAIKVSK